MDSSLESNIISMPWMDKMRSRLGIQEIKGKQDNPLIMEMYSYGNYPKQHDEVPWCAVAVGWALITTGFKGSHSAAAKSYDNYGTECKLMVGCIVTLKHPSGGRHVAFCDHFDDKFVYCLGGNQSNALNVKPFSRSEIVATRWPVSLSGEKPTPPRVDIQIRAAPLTPAEYLAKFTIAKIRPERAEVVQKRADLLIKHRARYEGVTALTQVPWYIVSCIHNQESGSDVGAFKAYLGNGEKIIGTGVKTTIVPKDRGPFKTWEEGAIDALGDKRNRDWSLGSALEYCEKYNGMGYSRRRIASPYLWAMTDQYVKGHYVRDGVFDPEAVSKNFGVVAIFKAMIGLGIRIR